jgi:DNA-binding transcriptional MerR regulator
MTKTYTIWAAMLAAGVTRDQVAKWESHGYLKPSHQPDIGMARQYSLADIIRLATLAELVRFRLPIELMAEIVRRLDGFDVGPSILAISHGPIDLVSCDPKASVRDKQIAKRLGIKEYNREAPALLVNLIGVDQVADYAADPDKRGLIIINLAHVQARVRAALTTYALDAND